MYTVKHAAALTGIAADTLRMWERRYHVVAPVRSAGGYRLYDDAAIARLTAMRALVGAGWAPREAARQVSSGTTAGPLVDAWAGRPPTDGDGGPIGDLDVLLPIAEDFDAVALEEVLAEMFARPDFEDVVDLWLLPALHRLGDAWHVGRVTVAGEHFVSAAVQRRLAGAYDAAPTNAGAPRVLVGLAGGSRHDLGVLAFAIALRRVGLDVLYVGGDLPSATWVVTVTGLDPDAVVLAVPSSDDVAPVRDAVAALVAVRPDLPVLLGGSHQDRVHGTVIRLGHRIGAGAQDVARRLA